MTKIYPGMPHLNGNLLCSVDFETTGLRAGYHEPIQLAVVPLDSEMNPLKDVKPFNRYIRPEFPERAEKTAMQANGLDLNDLIIRALDPGQVEELLYEWYNELDLPFGKCLVPIAHNWPFEYSFFSQWLGVEMTSKLFRDARDTMQFAIALNDRAHFMGEPPPFNYLSLGWLCDHFQIQNYRPHDALADSIAGGELYRHLLMMDAF